MVNKLDRGPTPQRCPLKPGFHPGLPDGLEFLSSLRNLSDCVGNGQSAGSGVVFHPSCWGQVYSLSLQALLSTLSHPALCPVFQSLTLNHTPSGFLLGLASNCPGSRVEAGKREVGIFRARSLPPLLWTLLLAESIRESPQLRLQLQPPSLWVPCHCLPLFAVKPVGVTVSPCCYPLCASHPGLVSRNPVCVFVNNSITELPSWIPEDRIDSF